MNELVKKLAVQSGFDLKAAENAFNGHILSNSLERFARAIINECVATCGSRVGNSDYNTGRMHCASDIKERFGVEE